MWEVVHREHTMIDVQNCHLCAISDTCSDIVYIFKNRIDGQIGFMRKCNWDHYVEKLSELDRKREEQDAEYAVKNKNKYDEVMINTAKNFAKLSTCKRLNVGAVVSKDGRPLVTGYNGTIAGTANDCEETCPVCCGTGHIMPISGHADPKDCERCAGGGKITSDTTVHAEQNAIFFASKNGISLNGTTMYVTHSPCKQCAKAIASVGIKRVVYAEFYRDSSGSDFLIKCGIEVQQH